jgi:hypothetical protein
VHSMSAEPCEAPSLHGFKTVVRWENSSEEVIIVAFQRSGAGGTTG